VSQLIRSMNAKNLELTVNMLAEKVGGEVIGDGSAKIQRIRALEIAKNGDLSFFAPTSKKKTAELLELAESSSASAILVQKIEPSIKTTQVVVKNPLGAIIGIAGLFQATTSEVGIHPTAVIHSTAQVDETASIGAYSVIGAGVSVGARTIVHPHVVIYPDSIIGTDCVIHAGAVIREGSLLGSDCLIQSGAVIGGDGFGYIPDRTAGHLRIPHLGYVVLEDGVDLGANTTVDRGTFGETRIGRSTKVDNLVMIAHNVKVGSRSLLCGQVGISGSSEIGNEVVLAGQVGVADHASIGDKVRAAAKSGISGEVPAGVDVAGYPHQEASKWRRTQVALRYLPELLKKRRLTS